MRVLIFAAFYPPDIGGYANNVSALAQGLAGRDCSVSVVVCSKEAGEYDDGQVHVYKLPCFQLLSGRYPAVKWSGDTVDVLTALLKQRFDVVNTQTRFYPITLLGLIFARVTRTVLIHTERGATHNLAFKGALGLLSRAYDHVVGTLVVRMADRVIGVSDGACEFARHLGAENPVTVHNGVSPEWFKTDSNRDPHSVIFTGRLIPAKGVTDLITAFKAVRSVMPNVRLTIVGDGPCRADLEAQNVDGVTFTGQKSREDTIALLSRHSVFMNPSYSEGLPTSVLEAMAAGLTVVATDVGGTRELITHGETGYLVEPGKPSQIAGALIRALADSDKVSKKAQEKAASEFSQDKCLEKMLAVYREVAHV